MWLSPGHAVNFPAPCPEVAPSDPYLRLKDVVPIVSSYPFYEITPSDTFRSVVDVLYVDSHLDHPINIRYVINTGNPPVELHWRFLSMYSASVAYNATVLASGRKALCSHEVIAEVRIFQGTWAGIGFIWTCSIEDVGETKRYGSQLILVVEEMINLSGQDVRTIARRDPVVDLNQIDPRIRGGSTQSFYCRPQKPEKERSPPVAAVVVCLVVLCLVAFRIKMYINEK